MIDLGRLAETLEAEIARRRECEAGVRPWKYRPGEHPLFPNGLAGLTREEALQVNELHARLRASGLDPGPDVSVPAQ